MPTRASKGCDDAHTVRHDPKGDQDTGIAKTFSYTDRWGDETKVRLLRRQYANGTLAVQVFCEEEKLKEFFSVNKKSGEVTVKKGLGKGTYKIKVTAAGDANHEAAAKTVTVKVVVR